MSRRKDYDITKTGIKDEFEVPADLDSLRGDLLQWLYSVV
jgi:hypothetical protein